ncbi:hypothetical protein LCGC14_0405420 [marine sediment metagenome]|uniref:Uncharacterized protein n=1 Tax=marine sediment metagenome TaxID=412755 RepID=A0A0F9W4L5_9ZZZZ
MDKNVAVTTDDFWGFLAGPENDFKNVFKEDLSKMDMEEQILVYERFGY